MQTTSTFFQKYQQEHFLDVAIDPNELAPADRPEPGAKYLPQTYLIHSTPEPITVLKTLPVGKPAVKEFEHDYPKVLENIKVNLASHSLNQPLHAEWEAFIASRPKTIEEARACTSLPKWNWPMRPSPAVTAAAAAAAVNDLSAPRRAAMRAAVAATTVVEQPRTVSDGLTADGAEGRAAREERTRADQERTLLPLEPNSFVMVRMNYTNAGGCQIPLLLAQCPADFGRLDTTNPKSMINLLWWEPKPGVGRYDGDWQKWMASRGVQCEEAVEREAIALARVGFTRVAELAGGFRKLGKPTRRSLLGLEQAKYGEYSNDGGQLG